MDLYDSALSKLKEKIGTEISQEEYKDVLSAPCTLEAALQMAEIEEMRNLNRHKHFKKIMRSFQNFVSPLERFKNTIDTITQANSLSLLIWGSIKLVLVVAKDAHESFQIVLECLEEIADNLPVFESYRTSLSEAASTLLMEPLVKINVEILTFNIFTIRLARRRTLHSIGNRLATTGDRGRFEKCIDIIKKQNKILESAAIREIHQIVTSPVFGRSRESSIASRSKPPRTEIHEVPGLLSSKFVGREAELRWLNEIFDSPRCPAHRKRAAVFGMTGVGKSQLVLKFEEMTRHKYTYVFWIVAGSQEKIYSSFQHMLDMLNLEERTRPEKHIKLAAIRNWLSSTSEWLLLFDNITEDDYHTVLEVLPTKSSGHVLFSSQRPGAMEKLTGSFQLCLELKVLHKEAAVQLLLDACEKERNLDNIDLAREIVSEIGLLPHAIDQSASYIRENSMNLSSFLERLRSEKDKVLSWKDEFAYERLRPSISTPFTISLQSLEKNYPDSSNLLRLFGFFEPEFIPYLHGWKRNEHYELRRRNPEKTKGHIFRRLFCSATFPNKAKAFNKKSPGNTNIILASQVSESVTDLVKRDSILDDAIHKLWSLSLVRRIGDNGIWIHELTHHFIRQTIPPDEYQDWLCLAIEVLYHTFPASDTTASERSAVDTFLPQATSVLKQARERGLEVEKYAKLSSICGTCYQNRGSYGKAIDYFEIARPAFETQLGTKDPRTLTLMHRIGWSHRESGNLALCEKYHRRVLADRLSILGPHATETLDSMNDLASTIERQGRLKEAEKLFSQSYEGQKQAFGLKDRRVLACAHNLALCYANQGKLRDGIILYEIALKGTEEVFGADYPGTLKTLSNLAVAIDHQGRLKEAENLNNRALDGYCKILGRDHLLTLRVRSNLSGLHRAQGRYVRAEEMIREVLEVFLKVLGPDHFHVAIAYYDLGEILHEEGRLQEARKCYQLSVAVMESDSCSPNHPLLLRTLDAFGILCRESGDLQEAELLATRAYESNLDLLGWDDPYTLVAANNFGEMLHAQGKRAEARSIYDRCLASFTKLLGEDHPHCMMVLNNLGRLAYNEEHYCTAIKMFQSAKRGYGSSLGEDHPCTLRVDVSLARTYLAMGQPEDAKRFMHQAHDQFCIILGESNPNVMITEHYLGEIYYSQGQNKKAEEHFSKAARGYELSFGNEHPNFCITMRFLDEINAKEPTVASPESAMDSNLETDQRKESSYPLRDPLSTTSTLNVNPSEILPWGETTRFRWGRKTCWREANESRLDT